MIKKLYYCVSFLAILGCMLNCQKSSNKDKSQQVLKINFHSPPPSFHPHFYTDVRTGTICRALYEGLTRIDPDGKATLAIAEKVMISPCKKIYTFTLRSSKWSNGEKVTSHDFIKTWEKVLSPGSFYAKHLFLIKNAKKYYEGKIFFHQVGIYAPSDNKLVIELEHPAPYFLQVLADPSYSPVYYLDSDKEQTVFNGPFTVESYDLNKQLNLVINPLYWDAGAVKLKRIEITLIKDVQTALSMYEIGELDWIGDPFSPIPIDLVKSFSNIKLKTSSYPFWIFCNTQNPKLKSEKIRKALSYAIDKEKIIKEVLPYQKILHTILSNELSILGSSYCFQTDIKKIQDLFIEGLKEIGISKNDFQIKLNYASVPYYERAAMYLKYQWEKIFGFDVILEKDEWNTFYSKIRSGDYEVGGFYVINKYSDPSYFMELFEYAQNHHTKWENPEYQKYFTLAKNSIDKEERKNYLRKAEEILMDKMPVIPICNRVYTYLCKENLKNFYPPVFSCSDFKWAYFGD